MLGLNREGPHIPGCRYPRALRTGIEPATFDQHDPDDAQTTSARCTTAFRDAHNSSTPDFTRVQKSSNCASRPNSAAEWRSAVALAAQAVAPVNARAVPFQARVPCTRIHDPAATLEQQRR